ncbi:MAG: MarR family winged helix-turn-helix transcriptional regulator [Methylophilaceae bacterium]
MSPTRLEGAEQDSAGTVQSSQHALYVSSSLRHFRVVFSSVKKHFRRIESQCGVSGSQLWVLWELHITPGLKVTELAQKLSIHQSTASNLIEKLVKKDLIIKQRQEHDQRVVKLYLSPQGQEVVAKAPSSPRGVLTDALDRLPNKDLVSLHQSLETLTAQIKLKDEHDALEFLEEV